MMIVIPAYQPDEKLTGVVDTLIAKTKFPIVIVDDGSRDDCRPLFSALAEREQVTVLHHEVNRGKGAAMKTAFQYVYDNCPDEEGVITGDLNALMDHPNKKVVNTEEFLRAIAEKLN